MSNQQVQNFLTALEEATDISVDADLTAESVTIEDSNGDELEISTSGGAAVTDDGSFEVAEILSTVTVTDDGSLDVSSVGGTVATEPQPGQNGSFGQQDVSTTAVEVVAANDDRLSVLVQNTGPETVYVGFDSSVTSASGVQIASGGTYADETYAGALYAVTASGTSDIRYQEVTL